MKTIVSLVGLAMVPVSLAARMKVADADQLSLSSAAEMTTMSQAVSMASGFLNVTANLDNADLGPLEDQCESLWPAEMSKDFKDEKLVGMGANACVFIATDKATGKLVAVKRSKLTSTEGFDIWKEECDSMQQMRLRSCRAGQEFLGLNEQYIPTCIRAGQLSEGHYYIMHAAGITPLNEKYKLSLTAADQKSLGAQIVAAMYAMHGIDRTHNDLHHGNIVLDNSKPPKVALVDFGEIVSVAESWTTDYKRDGAAIWRYLGEMARCPKPSWWQANKNTKANGDAFVGCMKTYSGNDKTFVSAIQKVVDGVLAENRDHGVVEVYLSNFIQNHLPKKRESIYPWKASEGCLKWSDKKWKQIDACFEKGTSDQCV